MKVTGEEIIVKEPKTAAGDRYVYFSPEMGSLLKEYRKECDWEAEAYECPIRFNGLPVSDERCGQFG